MNENIEKVKQFTNSQSFLITINPSLYGGNGYCIERKSGKIGIFHLLPDEARYIYEHTRSTSGYWIEWME